jgi:hypothetical protein
MKNQLPRREERLFLPHQVLFILLQHEFFILLLQWVKKLICKIRIYLKLA